MPVIIDNQLKEKNPYDIADFPISFYQDELETLAEWSGPLHWHPYFEIATAKSGVLDYQVGQNHIILEAGDSIFVNSNMIHGIRQVSGDAPDSMPNIVFSGTVVAPETSTIYQKYIQPIVESDWLPFIVFRQDNSQCDEVNQFINDLKTCYTKNEFSINIDEIKLWCSKYTNNFELYLNSAEYLYIAFIDNNNMEYLD